MVPSINAVVSRPTGQERRGQQPPAPPARTRLGRWGSGALAAALVLWAFVLPIWRSDLAAPQYPDGLEFVVYGDRAVGDLDEINGLNHYVGMAPFEIERFPEVSLWPIAIAAAVAAVAAATFLHRRRLIVALARIYLWGFPIGVLSVIQLRLYQLGHDLDPGAAFRMDGFTPLVVGPTTVWNFTAWSRPGGAIFALLAAAAVVSFGPRLARWAAGRLARPAASAAALAVVLTFAVPAPPAASHDEAGDLAALLAATPDGGTLVVPPGTYRGDVVIDRPVTLEGRDLPTIVGSGTGTVITVTAPGTVIRGIRVTGSGPGPSGGPAGIRIEADDVRVEGVTVEGTYIGIAAVGAARVYVVDNVIRGRGDAKLVGEGHATGTEDATSPSGGRGDGISLWDVDGALVRGNTVENTRDAVYVSFGSGALIDGNELRGNRYAVHSMFAADLVLAENLMEGNLSAAVLMYGGPALVLRNTIVDNRSPSTGFGVLVKDIADVEVVQNVIARNRSGLHIDSPGSGHPTRVTANTIARNHVGAVLYPASAAVFHANSFADNVTQVLQQGRGAAADVVWHDRGHGNFWSTYRGYDNGRGRGSTPHVEGSAVERLLVRAPVLTPMASSPAMRLVRAVEDRWALQRPVLVDPLPLTQPISPPLPTESPNGVAGVALGVVGGGTTILAAAALAVLARRPHTEEARR